MSSLPKLLRLPLYESFNAKTFRFLDALNHTDDEICHLVNLTHWHWGFGLFYCCFSSIAPHPFLSCSVRGLGGDDGPEAVSVRIQHWTIAPGSEEPLPWRHWTVTLYFIKWIHMSFQCNMKKLPIWYPSIFANCGPAKPLETLLWKRAILMNWTIIESATVSVTHLTGERSESDVPLGDILSFRIKVKECMCMLCCVHAAVVRNTAETRGPLS